MGLNQSQFARHLGIKSPQAYRNYENGRVPSDHETLKQIANRLKTSVDELLTGGVGSGQSRTRFDAVREGEAKYSLEEAADRSGFSAIKSEMLQAFLHQSVEAKEYETVIALATELLRRAKEEKEDLK